MESNGILRGINLPAPTYSLSSLPNDLNTLSYYSKLETFFPSLKTLFNIETISGEIWLDNKYKITNVNILNEDTIKGNCKLQVKYMNKSKMINAYLKVTHLIDPVTYVKKNTENIVYENDNDIKKKIEDPWNQAYVETLASYALGKLKEENVSPHFNLFYGAFRAVAKKYSYNISDEIKSYRMYKWFWAGIEKNIMKIQIDGEDSDEKKQLYDVIMNKPDYCFDNNKSSDDIEELSCGSINNELQSLDSVSIKTEETLSSSEETNESDESNESDEDDDLQVYLDFENYPVMMIFTEENESTLDNLLDDYEEVGCKPTDKLWEEKWSAWLFQIISSLCVAQSLFGLTHNDLHSNNIVWSYTDELYLYYKTNNNKYFKVPTYGKIFKIIDFGRSIFSINEHLFISDDFKDGNDAATQYNFPQLRSSDEEPIVYPNPSFDLSRLSISIFEGLFPSSPEIKKDAKILSEEPSRIVKETISPLYNLLWSWLVDTEGNNILLNVLYDIPV